MRRPIIRILAPLCASLSLGEAALATEWGCAALEFWPKVQTGYCTCDDTNPLTAPECRGLVIVRDPTYVCVRASPGVAGKTNCTTQFVPIIHVYPCRKDWDLDHIVACMLLAPACAVTCGECASSLGSNQNACTLCMQCLVRYLACGPCDVCSCHTTGEHITYNGPLGVLSGDDCEGTP